MKYKTTLFPDFYHFDYVTELARPYNEEKGEGGEKERLLHLLGYADWINHSMPSSSGGKRSESGRRPAMRAELPRMR